MVKVSLLIVCLSYPWSSGLDIQARYTTADGLPSQEVRQIFKDRNNNLWAGTGKGLAWKADDQWKTDNDAVHPVTNGVATLFQDSKGIYWFGGPGYAHSYDGEVYKSFSIMEDIGLEGRVVFDLYQDHNGHLWAGTTGGISVYNGENWYPFSTENGLNHQVVHDIAQDEMDRFWFATRRGGINIYDGSGWEYHHTDKNCRKILRDAENNMWVGTGDGILLYRNGEWKLFEEGNVVLPIFQGDKGLIWCISNGIDIIRIQADGRVIRYDNPIRDQAGEIYDLEYDKDGAIWAGTDKGIFVLK